MLPDKYILSRYQTKLKEFQKQAEITLLGHSLFDMWQLPPKNMPQLAGKSVANLGISGVTTKQYLHLLVKQHCIKHLGQHVFIYLGVNDICRENKYSPAQVVEWLADILQQLQQISPSSTYYLLEATPVNHVASVTNRQIEELNAYLKAHCPPSLIYIPTQPDFRDETGNLDRQLCTDGLHFNQAGYAILEKILTSYLTAPKVR